MAVNGQRQILRTTVLKYVRDDSHLLGTGSFGNVYEAIGPDKTQYAVKVSALSNVSDKDDQCVLTEAVGLSRFAHMHILQYLDCWEERDRQGARRMYLIMEYCQGRDLRYYLDNTLKHPPEEKLFGCWLAQIASGLEHIHSQNVLHRNLKTSKILVWCNKEQVVLKIGGFGLSKGLKHSDDVAKSMVGTANFMSPELLQGKAYDKKADIWSFGCTAFEVATLKSPKPNLVNHLDKDIKYSAFFKDIIRQMLNSDAGRRPDANTILNILAQGSYFSNVAQDGMNSSVSTASSEQASGLNSNCDKTPASEFRDRNNSDSSKGTAAKPPDQVQPIDIALHHFTLIRQNEQDHLTKKTVTFASSTASSGSGYETDISSFGMSSSSTASPRTLHGSSLNDRHSKTKMDKAANRNPDTVTTAGTRYIPNVREGCNSNSGSGYESDFDTDRDMWINEQIVTLQSDITRTIGFEVLATVYKTLKIKDETLLTIYLQDQLGDHGEEVCDKMISLWHLEKEKQGH
ncbi:serine/threonine-protein kinase Nek6-like [Haliotis rufescens]|uniref:serine/threonine-protein kinase Nek6-like n=1 Tax=Haliotis rufescens TaxID=6454 RepID=UPI00201F4BD8|nr:serine/threonine-protein kinase Nek6-like [Haliotis rufescens]XP_048257603.1 serine/threonine-protein kinase Nek6-like [Haliotis rufescens]